MKYGIVVFLAVTGLLIVANNTGLLRYTFGG